jgi:hypothetical protein
VSMSSVRASAASGLSSLRLLAAFVFPPSPPSSSRSFAAFLLPADGSWEGWGEGVGRQPRKRKDEVGERRGAEEEEGVEAGGGV